MRIEKCERSEKKRGKEERESDLVCVALMPGDTTTFEDGQKRRRRDEWREPRECDKRLKRRCKKNGKIWTIQRRGRTSEEKNVGIWREPRRREVRGARREREQKREERRADWTC